MESSEKPVIEVEVEYLTPEDVPEDIKVELSPLSFSTPIELFKNLFDSMVGIRSKIKIWESKTRISNAKTRDEAIQLRTTVTRTAKAIDEAYLELSKPAREYLEQLRELKEQAKIDLVGTKDNPALGVAGRLTTKISDYAAECKRIEEEMKAKALAEQKALEEKKAAEERERQMEEMRLREEENRRLEEIQKKKELEAEQRAANEGSDVVDMADTDIAVEQEQARIDAERAERERVAEQKRIQDEKELEEQQRKTVNTMAIAASKGKVKGVQDVWTIELIDETLLDKKYMIFEPAKARAALKAGFYDKKEKDAEKIIPGLRCVLVLGKGGK